MAWTTIIHEHENFSNFYKTDDNCDALFTKVAFLKIQNLRGWAKV